jgi:phosphoglucosamine mutase
MGRLFGTDGARGVAITELTCELAMQIGRAAALVLTKKMSHKPTIYIGKDTRISSDILEAALVAGICSVGANAELLGVVPTPAVAALVRKNCADAGVMISASHNSMEFNGIKLFSSTGYKLSDEIEEEIERLILDTPEEIVLASGGDVGRVSYYKDAQWDYIRYVMRACSTADLKGIRVALDCANGSASVTAQKLFEGMGATCFMLNANADGTNINDKCGSTHMGDLMKFVKECKCHVGLAFDGDADRCLAVDENGEIVDGDKLIAICAKSYKEAGKLKNNTAVVTVMTNIGFSYFAKENEINVVTSKVGDRYVLEKMIEGGYNIGGEQSGHIIFLDDATTGDGQLSGLKVLEILAKSGKRMSELAKIMESFPQVMINVKINTNGREVWKNDNDITDLIEKH